MWRLFKTIVAFFVAFSNQFLSFVTFTFAFALISMSFNFLGVDYLIKTNTDESFSVSKMSVFLEEDHWSLVYNDQKSNMMNSERHREGVIIDREIIIRWTDAALTWHIRVCGPSPFGSRYNVSFIQISNQSLKSQQHLLFCDLMFTDDSYLLFLINWLLPAREFYPFQRIAKKLNEW